MIHFDDPIHCGPRLFTLLRPSLPGMRIRLTVERADPAAMVEVQVQDALGLMPIQRLDHTSSTLLHLRARAIWTITLSCTGCRDLELIVDARQVDVNGRRMLGEHILCAHLIMTCGKDPNAEPDQMRCGRVEDTGLRWALRSVAPPIGDPDLRPVPLIGPQ